MSAPAVFMTALACAVFPLAKDPGQANTSDQAASAHERDSIRATDRQGLARALTIRGRHTEAAELLKPDATGPDFQPFFKIGDLYERAGNADSALLYFRLSLERNPCNRHALARCVALLAQQGNTEEARARADEALLLFPEDPALIALRGRIGIIQGRLRQGAALLENLCDLYPDSVGARLFLATAYEKAGRWGSAFRHYRTMNNRPGMDRVRGRLYDAGKRHAKTEGAIAALARKQILSARDWFDIGALYASQENDDSARACFGRVPADSLQNEVRRETLLFTADTIVPVSQVGKIVYAGTQVMAYAVATEDRNRNNRIDPLDGFSLGFFNGRDRKTAGVPTLFYSIVPFDPSYNLPFVYGYTQSENNARPPERTLYRIDNEKRIVPLFECTQLTTGMTAQKDGSILFGKTQTDEDRNNTLDLFDGFYLHRWSSDSVRRVFPVPFSGVLKNAYALDNNLFLLVRYTVHTGKKVFWIDDVADISIVGPHTARVICSSEIRRIVCLGIYGGIFTYADSTGIYRIQNNKPARIWKGRFANGPVRRDSTGFFFSDSAGKVYQVAVPRAETRQLYLEGTAVKPVKWVAGRGLFYTATGEGTGDQRALFIFDGRKTHRLSAYRIDDQVVITPDGSAAFAPVHGLNGGVGIVRMRLGINSLIVRE
ncbi:MAG: hypothetical protein A2268_16050 [Candidatus Raymondbacteria bacterium RifOxyA12_full_50_37]|uniref:Uncharacterized protein n=1 Tax=Candidatus Raymondbacteria bacterium RIFOXYD12_FULL_49_13 TaxID=1817890 RepID=A0A1F7FBQ0_UNCRA|nr:MAG: hypothetical protein A2268_16050 [Candidatus Raymondbacteria bacterium RifOxyA12_full_50_37]OGJ92440.1 MAG: hypothetical protein A2248_11560 [Candidatus Raymondbacteria bacterium RIFOXYA2_FULL_49_16]OGJ94495.1 MAG: hypothetical protein A2350_07860 [Candidatus Raymondbacteria bacterium RifOxyB12_full_50_8]OGJ95255.1 MAG: hypothetical protein A2453_05670 [Candidatus Raymondbacteria bacterium RIFOXYC2_FULL_50_21]OGK04094.1 MAG: hypothetical protein A2519_19515 [Candidatus Raymondbacteria b